jgi:hypothetical protein
MALYQKYNNEDILIRGVIAGLLDILNNHIQYKQVWGNEDEEIIEVPWFYNQSGDERFMQDFYTHYAECLPPRPVDGNFDVIPRGSITYTGSTINAQRITSRYVQGRYVKEVDGKLESYVSFLYSIPLSVRIDCELRIDRQISALKIEQEIRETFYKTLTYYTYYKGLRVGCTAGFPEDLAIEKNIQYSFESNNPIKLTFSLEIETYQPVFDKTTEMKATTRIKGFSYDLHQIGQKNPGAFVIKRPTEGSVIPKGIPYWVEWGYTRENYSVPKVNLYWLYSGSNNRNEIDIFQPNNEYYIWNIPSDFTSYKEPTILWEETNKISISRDPVVKIIPDLSTGQITASSFLVFNPGYFLTGLTDSSINIQLEMKDDSGKISYTPDGAIWANIHQNLLDSSIPFVVSNDVSIYFPGTVDFKVIDLNVANSNNPDGTSDSPFGIVNKITIV